MKRALLLLLFACGGPEHREHTAVDLEPLCLAQFRRLAACTDAYLAAELDIRIELNMPPDTRSLVASQGRDAVLAISRAQWAERSTPDQPAATCHAVAQAPPDQVERLFAQEAHCQSAPDCAGFGRCAAEDERAFIASGASH